MNRVRLARALREAVTWSVLALALSSTAGFAWLTRHPEHPLVARAAALPVVGAAARLFQDRWLPPPGSVAIEPGAAGASTVTRVVLPVREVEVEDFFVLPDLPEDPRAVPWSEPILPLRWDGAGPPPLGMDPVPVGPLPGRRADPARLAAARSFFVVPPMEAALGGYALLTDVDDDDLLAALRAVVMEVEPLYRARYALDPVGEPAETIVVYRSEVSYRQLQGRSDRIRDLTSRGHVGWGLVALYAGLGRERRAVAPVLRHELAHQLNRRSLGPALPPWLDEGIAEDFAAHELDVVSGPRETPLGTMRQVEDDRVEIWGALAGLDQLARSIGAGAAPELQALVALDWDAFVAEPGADLHYAASAWLVRYLLDPRSEVGPGFHTLLRQVARGGGAGTVELEAALGRGLSELEPAWRDYVVACAAMAGVGAPVDG